MESMEALHLAELLCSRICHDLSGPVGAAAAGAELIAELGGGEDGETLELVSSSASAASARLAYLRAAFGYATQPQRSQVLRTLIEKYFGSLTQGALSPLALEWRITEAELTADASRLMLNLVMTARDALPRGGVVVVDGSRTNNLWNINVIARGEGVKLAEEAHDVLVDGATATGPRGAQALLLKILSARLGISILTHIEESSIKLTVG